MEQFNDDRFFQYPPFNRHHAWRRDYDYEVPVVSSVGSGPKGEKGDTFKYDDLTPAELESFGQLLIDSGAARGKSAYEIAMIEEYGDDESAWDTVDEWLESLKGDQGDPGEDGSFVDLDQEELTQVYNTLRGQLEDWVRNRITGFTLKEDVAYGTPTDHGRGDGLMSIRLSSLFSNPAPSENDIYIVTSNGLILNPWPTRGQGQTADTDYFIDENNSEIVFTKDIHTSDSYDEQSSFTVYVRRIRGQWIF